MIWPFHKHSWFLEDYKKYRTRHTVDQVFERYSYTFTCKLKCRKCAKKKFLEYKEYDDPSVILMKLDEHYGIELPFNFWPVRE